MSDYSEDEEITSFVSKDPHHLHSNSSIRPSQFCALLATIVFIMVTLIAIRGSGPDVGDGSSSTSTNDDISAHPLDLIASLEDDVVNDVSVLWQSLWVEDEGFIGDCGEGERLKILSIDPALSEKAHTSTSEAPTGGSVNNHDLSNLSCNPRATENLLNTLQSSFPTGQFDFKESRFCRDGWSGMDLENVTLIDPGKLMDSTLSRVNSIDKADFESVLVTTESYSSLLDRGPMHITNHLLYRLRENSFSRNKNGQLDRLLNLVRKIKHCNLTVDIIAQNRKRAMWMMMDVLSIFYIFPFVYNGTPSAGSSVDSLIAEKVFVGLVDSIAIEGGEGDCLDFLMFARNVFYKMMSRRRNRDVEHWWSNVNMLCAF